MAQISASAPLLVGLVSARPLTRLQRLARFWAARQDSRRALAQLDPHLLRDIGLSAQDAGMESEKPFWRD
ncbi:DUF1127 domain-containing protein [Rhodobacter ferrooxidans]|uniref:YjiS-like domain-containing protein n=1 Tax=Rhodobacter ferrooxidans TaxID=371731 RepID=C8S0L4_9RHOB|nr:DUF1127 domain-containing protein [Rhodobacter sp. SW2]EEW25548.1 hypothetical protein Rsw2DRAFT_1592 [Rhodobacter sp. SW2]